MKKVKYLDLVIDGYFFKLDTKENLGNHLELYYTTTQDDNIHLKKPLFERADEYGLNIKGEEIYLPDYLVRVGTIKKEYLYLIISIDMQIISFEEFPVGLCEEYFSIPINRELANFIYRTGIDNFFIKEYCYKDSIVNLSSYEFLNPYEILFFISSESKEIRALLNNFRKDYLSKVIRNKTNILIRKGIVYNYEMSIYTFTYNFEDEYEVLKILNSGEETTKFVNNNVEHILPFEVIINICDKLLENKEKYLKYERVYLDYLNLLLDNDTLLDEASDKPVLNYGYVNEYIERRICDE